MALSNNYRVLVSDKVQGTGSNGGLSLELLHTDIKWSLKALAFFLANDIVSSLNFIASANDDLEDFVLKNLQNGLEALKIDSGSPEIYRFLLSFIHIDILCTLDSASHTVGR